MWSTIEKHYHEIEQDLNQLKENVRRVIGK